MNRLDRYFLGYNFQNEKDLELFEIAFMFILGRLTEREQIVITRKFGLDGYAPENFKSIAKKLPKIQFKRFAIRYCDVRPGELRKTICSQRVNQILIKARRRIKYLISKNFKISWFSEHPFIDAIDYQNCAPDLN